MRCVTSVQSSFGFWIRHITLPVKTELHVYPDFNSFHTMHCWLYNRLALLGVRRTRKVGQDNEFERLREYTRDDHYKNINWRSSATTN